MHYAVKNNKMDLLPILLQHPSIDMAAMKDMVTICIVITSKNHASYQLLVVSSFVCLNHYLHWTIHFVCSRYAID